MKDLERRVEKLKHMKLDDKKKLNFQHVKFEALQS